MIYWKNDKKNLYLSLTTGTSYNKDLLPLNAPTDSQVKMSYVNKKPFLGKRKDYGNKVLVDMKFSKLDKKMILHDISKAEPRYSKTYQEKINVILKKCGKRKISNINNKKSLFLGQLSSQIFHGSRDYFI